MVQVWSFAPPADPLTINPSLANQHPTFRTANPMNLPLSDSDAAITPYQDPAFGDRPVYDYLGLGRSGGTEKSTVENGEEEVVVEGLCAGVERRAREEEERRMRESVGRAREGLERGMVQGPGQEDEEMRDVYYEDVVQEDEGGEGVSVEERE